MLTIVLDLRLATTGQKHARHKSAVYERGRVALKVSYIDEHSDPATNPLVSH